MSNSLQPVDVPRILLSVIFLSAMIIACLWIMQPFIPGFAWAATVVIASWPLLIYLQRLLWGKRVLAVIAMMLLIILVLVIPVLLLVSSLLDSRDPFLQWLGADTIMLPELNWLQQIPLVGGTLYSGWHNLMEAGAGAFIDKIRPYIGATTGWFIGQAAHIGRLFIHFALMLVFSALLYWRGEQVAQSVRCFACRLGSSRGEEAALLAVHAIRAVALGVVITALTQAILAGIGLAVAGVPYATLLTLIMLLSCLVQLGPLPVLIPAVIWLYWSGDNVFATGLLVWSGIVSLMDMVIRPLLIRMGAKLPMILILTGVIGGLIAFGMIGLFIGPTLLAICWRLYSMWLNHEDQPAET